MRKALIILILFWPYLAAVEVLNVEFKFTPYVGDPAKSDLVETVPGKATVFINNVPFAEQEVDKSEVPVLFEECEIAPSVWLPVDSLGPALRKGKNTIRIEFEPTDAKAPYRAQLRWASVTDQTTEESEPGGYRTTNQTGEGVEDKEAKGKIIFEREFVADFAADLPWHHYPPVTTLSDDDKRKLAALVKERADAFKPNFAGVYKILETNQNVSLAEVKNSKCLDAAYSAGVRIATSAPDQLEFVTTGNPEVLIRSKSDNLYYPSDPQSFDKIKGDEVQMCAGTALFVAYPPHLAVVRTPAGIWEVVY